MKVGNTMYFLYGNELRSARIEEIRARQNERGLEVLYGFLVVDVAGISGGEMAIEDALEAHTRLELLPDYNAFSSLEALVEAHVRRYHERKSQAFGYQAPDRAELDDSPGNFRTNRAEEEEGDDEAHFH
jgi:hypothetical protein